MTNVVTGRDNWGDHTVRNRVISCDDVPSVGAKRVETVYDLGQ